MHEEIQKLLSAFLDGELTQADHQRVRIHMENCAECRREYEDLEKVRNLTVGLAFPNAPEDRMQEIEQRLSVRAPRRFGWGVFLIGTAFWALYAAYQFVTAPGLPPWEKLMTAAVVVGLVSLLVSVGRQRWLELPHDKYRGVRK